MSEILEITVPIEPPKPIIVTMEVAQDQDCFGLLYMFQNPAARGLPTIVNPGNSGARIHPQPGWHGVAEAPEVPPGAQWVNVNVFIEDTQDFRCRVYENAIVDGKWKRALIKTVLPVDDFTPFFPDAERWFEFEYLAGSS